VVACSDDLHAVGKSSFIKLYGPKPYRTDYVDPSSDSVSGLGYSRLVGLPANWIGRPEIRYIPRNVSVKPRFHQPYLNCPWRYLALPSLSHALQGPKKGDLSFSDH
jgi:hypothetical protein